MNAVAAMKFNLAQIKEHGANVTLADLDERLSSESFSDADQQECREWLDGMLAQEGPQYRALDALVSKLTTIGSAIAERLNQTAVEQLSVEEVSRLLETYLDFKQVIEEVVPKPQRLSQEQLGDVKDILLKSPSSRTMPSWRSPMRFLRPHWLSSES